MIKNSEVIQRKEKREQKSSTRRSQQLNDSDILQLQKYRPALLYVSFVFNICLYFRDLDSYEQFKHPTTNDTDVING